MPTFQYRAVAADGRRERGVEEAPTAAGVLRSLEGRGLLVLEVAETRPVEGVGGGVLRLGRRRAVLGATRALASLLAAGLPLARALATAEHMASPGVRGTLRDLRGRIERGDALSDALAEHPDLFPSLYVGLVRAGERTGDLAGAFGRLSSHLEREAALRSRLASAAVYPVLLFSVGTVAILVLFFFVLPRFAALLEGVGAQLPRSTQLLLGLAELARYAWPALPPLLLGVLLTLLWQQATEGGRRAGAALLLRTPGIGALRRQALGARFARLVAVLLGGGAPLVSALDGAAGSLADPIAREEAARIRRRVCEGASLRTSLAEGAFFPPVLLELVAIGEDSSRLEEFTGKAADLLEEQVERTLQRLATLAEPVLIVAFGIVVGFVALSLLQAVYGVNAGAIR